MTFPLYVVIPSHNRPELAIRTLKSLVRCVVPETHAGTIVVENGSRSLALERYIEHLDSRHNVLYTHTALANKSVALNDVVTDLPQDALIIFFDDDISIHPYTLVAYEQAARNYPDASHFGGSVMPDYRDEPPPPWLRHYLPASALGWTLGADPKAVHHGVFMGCNWAARQLHLVRAGLFDTSTGPGNTAVGRGEETLMQQALLQQENAGLYVPNALVWHNVPVERCSTEWAIATAYEQSKGRAYRAAKVAAPGMNRSRAASFVLSLVVPPCLRMLSPFISEHKQFWLEYRYQAARGYLAGIKLGISETKTRPRD